MTVLSHEVRDEDEEKINGRIITIKRKRYLAVFEVSIIVIINLLPTYRENLVCVV
jgi:hypothetical protein